MSSVDNRIVKMGFDNAQFMSAANATINTLKQLGNNLKLSEGTKGLENIASKVKNVDMATLASGVDTVKQRFSAMEIVGVTALVNITNSALNAGKNLVNSLTIAPITDGFREYETKMNALQTIMTNTASKGTTMEEIKNALAELNEYSDLTIYNFAQMTDNIGKFTAAGVSLDDSVTAIKGLSNVAAGFGVDATKMAGATYQMSQMLASGKMMAQDWNSMVQAGMAGESLQQAFVQTAASMGIFKDETVSFKDSLRDGWLTSEVFIETMKKMADDPSLLAAAQNVTSFTKLVGTMQEVVGSGWAMSWEYIFGDKEQSTALFTGISNGFAEMANNMSKYRNEALKYWNEQGGREAVIRGLSNILKSISNVLSPIYEAFRKIIDPWNGERLVSLSKGFEKLTEILKIGDRTSSAIGITFSGLFSIIKILGMVLKPVGALMKAVLTATSPLVDVVFILTEKLTGWINKVAEAIETSGALPAMMNWFAESADATAKGLDTVISKSGEWISKGLGAAKEHITNLATTISELARIGGDKINSIKSFVTEFVEVYKPMEKAKDFVLGVFDSIQNGLKSFVEFLSESIRSVQNFFGTIVENFKSLNIQGIDFLNAGLFAGLLLSIKKIIPIIKNAFTSIGDFKGSAIGLLDSARDSLEAYQKNLKAKTIKDIAIAVAILAGSLFVLSKIEPDRLLPALGALGGTLTGLLVAMKVYDKLDPKSFGKTMASVFALIGVSIALGVLAGAMRKLAKMDWDDIGRAVAGMTVACVAIFTLTKILNKSTIKPSQGVALMLIAASMTMLAGAFALFGLFNVGTLIQGVTTLGVSLLVISGFMNIVKSVGNPISIAISLIPLTTSMLILAGVLGIFGNMNIGTLIQGTTVLTIALGILSAFFYSLKSVSGNILSACTGIFVLSGALIVLSGALAIFGNMDIVTLAVGLGTMGVALFLISKGMRNMPANMPMMSAGILALGGALMLLSISLRSFGNMSVWEIGKSLLMMAGIIGVFAKSCLLVAPAIPLMMAVAVGVGALGAACAVVGGGLALLSFGLTTFSGAVIAAGVGFTGALIAICAVIPVFAAAVALGFVSFLSVLGYNAEAIQRALTSLLDSLLQTVIDCSPKFAEAVIAFLTGLVEVIKEMTPIIIDAIVQIVMGVMETFTTNGPIIAKMVADFLLTLLIDTLTSLADAIPKITGAVLDVIISIIFTIASSTIRVTDAIWDLVISMINAFADGVENKMPAVRGAIKNVISAIIEEFVNCVGDMVNIGGDIIGGVVRGISGGIGSVVDAAKSVASSALTAAKDFLGIHSPSREFESVGLDSDRGLANGLRKHSGLVETEAESVADGALNSMRNALAQVSALMTDDPGDAFVITPVMDLSEIQNGTKNISSMLGGDYKMSATLNRAQETASRFSRLRDTLSGGVGDVTTNNSTTQVVNNWHIQGTNSREIADEVGRIMRKQVDRKENVWA